MLPNSTTLYDGCASGMVWVRDVRPQETGCAPGGFHGGNICLTLVIIGEFELEISNDRRPENFLSQDEWHSSSRKAWKLLVDPHIANLTRSG